MPLPPWQLYSRTRVLYYIADEAALKRFGTEESIVADHHRRFEATSSWRCEIFAGQGMCAAARQLAAAGEGALD